jgi:cyclopropane-fatty-acyl-phospholipid synthase
VRSALYEGVLMHARTTPAANVFRYPVCFYVIDLDEVGELDRRLRLFGHNRPAPLSLYDRDHLGDPERPIAENVRDHLAGRGVDAAGGRILMLTNLRVAGYVFNPVTFFYCYSPAGDLRCVLAEVANTFGERLPYLLDDRVRVPSDRGHVFRHDKRMHVSPFFGLAQEYEFRLTDPGERVSARIDVHEDGGRAFHATLSGRRRELTDRTLARTLARYPLMTVQVTALIHWQALRLWAKRVPFHRKPAFTPGEGSVPEPSRSSEQTPSAAPARPRGLRPVPEVRRSPLAPLVRSGMLRLLRRPVGGAVEVATPDGLVRRLGDPGADRRVRVTVRSRDLYRRLASRGRVGLGEAYQAGDFTSDDLVGLLEILARTAEDVRRRPPGSWLVRLQELRPHLPSPTDLVRARRDIKYHYDLGNDLYRLFLDPSLTYSCAYFEHPGQLLADAQQAKYRRICEKLRLAAGERVLEIGCGWGGFALHAAREWGARVTGITISDAQAREARRRVEEAGLEDRVEIRVCDYRELDGRWDKVVSIEMLEAVGEKQLPVYFGAVDRLMGPGGVACIQTIAVPDQRLERYRRGNDWIREYIFPGGYIPSLGAVVAAMTTGSELCVEGVENIGIHYAETLRVWRETFLARRDEVLALGFDETFVRTWEYYLAFCEAGFRTRALADYQVVMSRPFNDRLPEYPGERISF